MTAGDGRKGRKLKFPSRTELLLEEEESQSVSHPPVVIVFSCSDIFREHGGETIVTGMRATGGGRYQNSRMTCPREWGGGWSGWKDSCSGELLAQDAEVKGKGTCCVNK